jgi:hypothetical protein
MPAALPAPAQTVRARAAVRAFQQADVAPVLALRQQCFGSTEHESEDALARYFTELFFGHPWYDDTVPSLVAEDAEHRIVGFLGVIPRPMLVDGTPIRVATTTHFMAARSAGPLVAVALLRTLFGGPQDLAIADVSSDRVRQLWTYLGGVQIPAGTLAWYRLLRPAQHAAARLHHRGAIGLTARLAARAVDTVAGTYTTAFQRPRRPARAARRPLGDAELLGRLHAPGDQTFHGVYDEASLAWLLAMMARKRWFGTLRRTEVVDDGARPLGWYVAYTRPHGSALVADLGARAGAAGTVIDHLLDEAAGLGCTAVSGRFDARIADDLGKRGALVVATPNGIVAHSRNQTLLARLARANTPLSRLDGEWWMAF